MKTNQGTINLAEHVADRRSIESVLRGWGYEENEIQQLLKEQTEARMLDNGEVPTCDS